MFSQSFLRIAMLVLVVFISSCSDSGDGGSGDPADKGGATQTTSAATLDASTIDAFAQRHCADSSDPRRMIKRAFGFVHSNVSQCTNPGTVTVKPLENGSSITWTDTCAKVQGNEVFANGSASLIKDVDSGSLTLTLTLKGEPLDVSIDLKLDYITNTEGGAEFSLSGTLVNNANGESAGFDNVGFSVVNFDAFLKAINGASSGVLDNVTYTGGRLTYSKLGYVDVSVKDGVTVLTGANNARLEIDSTGLMTFFAAGSDVGQVISGCGIPGV